MPDLSGENLPPRNTGELDFSQPQSASFVLSISGNTVNVVLLDGTGAVTPAPIGGQVFTATIGTGATLDNATITIPAGSSSGAFNVSSASAGVYKLTVYPGIGPLSGQSSKGALVNFDTDSYVPLASCVNGITRPVMRSAIRRMLGFTPQEDNRPGGVVGNSPAGESWPSDVAINQAIGNAIAKVNAKANWYVNTNVTVSVPSTNNTGVQFFPLQGIGGGGSNQNIINQVKRVLWVPPGGVPQRLYPTDYRAMDRANITFDTYSPGTPQWYLLEGYQLGLLPGAGQAGTLNVWAGTGVPNFCSDTDLLDEMPVDHIPLIEYLAVVFINQTNLSRPESALQVGSYAKLAQDSMDDFLKWVARISPAQQPSLRYGRRSPSSYRVV